MLPGRETFAERSADYASARPTYPPELFAWLADQVARRELAWDCGTGNGQAAIGLAPYFERVHASDRAAEQVAHGEPRANVTYAVHPAEATPLTDATVDLIVVAQALHWFDFARFWPEVARVARAGAYFCAWGYAWFESPPEVDGALVAPLRDLLVPFWAPQNRLVWEGYREADVAFPFVRERTPAFEIRVTWTVDQLLAYLATWSAYKRSRADATAARAVDELFVRARTLVPPHERLPIRMALATLAARIGP